MKAIGKYALSVIMLFIIITVIYHFWGFYTLGPWTRDAKIRVEISQISAEVSGQLVELPIIDNQEVKKGDLLFKLDPRDYKIQLDNAEAALEELKASRENAKRLYQRRARAGLSVSKENLDSAKTDLDTYDAKIKQAKASLDKAKLDLTRTAVYAPTDGYITNLKLRVSDYVNTGTSLFALVDKNSFYVMAYFEETKLGFLKIGKKVEITSYSGNKKITGVITGIGRAIIDQSASTGDLLIQDVQPNYPWVRLAQRVPVKIETDDWAAYQQPLIAGTTCFVKIIDKD